MFQGCNVKRRGSGSLGVSWILGAAWSSQLWGPHPIPRTPIPYWEGKCHHEGTVCSGHVGSVGIVWPGGDFCFSRPDPTPQESILRDDLLGLCLFISPSDREAFTCFKAPQLLPPELPVLFFWAALLCASRKKLFQMVEITANHLSLEQRCCCFIKHQTLGFFFLCASHKYSVGIMAG